VVTGGSAAVAALISSVAIASCSRKSSGIDRAYLCDGLWPIRNRYRLRVREAVRDPSSVAFAPILKMTD
jgi:hypothetical protein